MGLRLRSLPFSVRVQAHIRSLKAFLSSYRNTSSRNLPMVLWNSRKHFATLDPLLKTIYY